MYDWTRLAEPQLDGYDVEGALAIHGEPVSRFNDRHTFCDGLVSVRSIKSQPAPWLVPGPLDHPNLAEAEALLKRWPAGYRSFTGLISVFYPLIDTTRDEGYGSTCGSDEREPHALYATVYDALGLAEALVHEAAHQKLRRLGIRLESHTRLIANDSGELYVSPVRKDKLRPMSAVVHAQYSYTYVLSLDVAAYEAETDQAERQKIRHALEINTARMREGRTEIQNNLKTTTEGAGFFDGYFDWLDRTLAESADLLGK